ncbi:MAG: LapA family protein [Anaerolineales bacterium]|uniref:LapA family protein n=1 Tax=Candidatus Desulfolinea nitratireducens TaxID=2841698 RepID=A0A8J6TGH5_9CHLR|nr:LapA family protein [Candidatus Desulfolinea nitratireducens]MBL6959527.1 LapA family protein [Anaerolineales bacterium]
MSLQPNLSEKENLLVIFTLILALAFAVVAVIFALGNPESVTVTFLNFQLTESLALVLLVTLAFGLLIGVLLMTPGAIKRSVSLSMEKKRLKGTEKELDKHKSKVTELKEKGIVEEQEKAQVIADVQKKLDDVA